MISGGTSSKPSGSAKTSPSATAPARRRHSSPGSSATSAASPSESCRKTLRPSTHALSKTGGDPLFAERWLLGFTHAEAGAEILYCRRFPANLVDAVRGRHEPEMCAHPLASLLALTEIRTRPGEAFAPPRFVQAVLDLSEPAIGLLQCLIGAA